MSLNQAAIQTRDLLLEYIQQEVQRYGSSKAIKPGHHVRFQWPPHPISAEYQIPGHAFKDEENFILDGRTYTAQFAETEYGTFGRIEHVWNEARGKNKEEALETLKRDLWPWLYRQTQIAQLLGNPEAHQTNIAELQPLDLLKLLYAPDRDIAHESSLAIEAHASTRVFAESLIAILRDQTHPYRRSAQWCALDLFEDILSFCPEPGSQVEVIAAIKDLISHAQDDYARTIYKAGVVLGGHISTESAGQALLECFDAPHKIGRRAAYHASFHLAEWMPELRDTIVRKLLEAAERDPEPILRHYAEAMAKDVAEANEDHPNDPTFPDE